MKIIELPSPNFDERGDVQIEYLIFHYTGMKTAQAALDRLTNKQAEVSAHYTIDENGGIYKHVDDDKRAWHAGVSSWQGDKAMNAKSIGIELVNLGHEFGYCEFPIAQIETLKKLSLDVLKKHPSIKLVLGHSDVAPDRKEDPGELFPWAEFAKVGIGAWPEMISSASPLEDVYAAIRKLGYGSDDDRKLLVAFQRHFVPEVFVGETQGVVCDLTKLRLAGLIEQGLLFTK